MTTPTDTERMHMAQKEDRARRGAATDAWVKLYPEIAKSPANAREEFALFLAGWEARGIYEQRKRDLEVFGEKDGK